MSQYLIQVAYTTDAWEALIKSPQDRIQAVRPVVERLGGSVVGGWLAFGEYDVVAVFDLPDNVSAAALSMAVAAGGAVKAIKTTPLMTIAEGMQAMTKAAVAEYQPPGYDSYG